MGYEYEPIDKDSAAVARRRTFFKWLAGVAATTTCAIFLTLFHVRSEGKVVAAAAIRASSMDVQHIIPDVNSPKISPCAYKFSVCSNSSTGDEGVDFRSHFAIYGVSHNLSGWVRNNCNKCVYGMFAGGMTADSDCSNAYQFYEDFVDPNRILTRMDNRANGISTKIESVTGYPGKDMCDNGLVLPEWFVADDHPIVDWIYDNGGCSSPCDCLPQTPYKDCQATGTHTVPPGKDYLDCRRFPMGSDTTHFPDCNSLYYHEGKSCWKIDDGNIVSSGKCGSGNGSYEWVNDTAAAVCCGPYDVDYEYGRHGLDPAPNDNCQAYGPNNLRMNKCIPNGKPGYDVDGKSKATIEREEEEMNNSS